MACWGLPRRTARRASWRFRYPSPGSASCREEKYAAASSVRPEEPGLRRAPFDSRCWWRRRKGRSGNLRQLRRDDPVSWRSGRADTSVARARCDVPQRSGRRNKSAPDGDGNQGQAQKRQTILNNEAATLDSLGGCEVKFTICGSSGHIVGTSTCLLSLNFRQNRATKPNQFDFAHNLFVSGSSNRSGLSLIRCRRFHVTGDRIHFPEVVRRSMIASVMHSHRLQSGGGSHGFCGTPRNNHLRIRI